MTETNRSAIPIRGALPWHNFLCGPSAWNEDDYCHYLNGLQSVGLNLVVFHNYTGGQERYAPYVEPMVRLRYRGVEAAATFDTSLTARWGSRPLATEDFAFGADLLFHPPAGARAFGADAAVCAKSYSDHYAGAQGLMRRVMEMAHERGIRFAMGFEFGIHPPEFLSLVGSAAMLNSSGILDPFSAPAIALLRSAIDDILAAYPGVDQIWFWQHEFVHLAGPGPQEFTRERGEFEQLLASEGGGFDPHYRFGGVWTLAYLRQAYAYLKQRAPSVTMVLSGWSNEGQLPSILGELHKKLPLDIVFSCLQPDQGAQPNPAILAEIAATREVWGLPWLEGDAAMWHFQPRSGLVVESVRRAAADGYQGVVALHWRTEDVKGAFQAFAHVASNPAWPASVEEIYAEFCCAEYGYQAGAAIAPLLAALDREQLLWGRISPEYLPYNPCTFGRLDDLQIKRICDLLQVIELNANADASDSQCENLAWLANNMRFYLQLDAVGRAMEPAFRWQARWWQASENADSLLTESAQVLAALDAAPLRDLFETFISRVRSRGELGVLSSLNQRVWLLHKELKEFIAEAADISC
jgi:hypothetical protein